MSKLTQSLERISYTIPNACAAADVGRTSIYAAIKSGGLKTVKVGRRRLVLRDDLLSWLRSQRV